MSNLIQVRDIIIEKDNIEMIRKEYLSIVISLKIQTYGSKIMKTHFKNLKECDKAYRKVTKQLGD